MLQSWLRLVIALTFALGLAAAVTVRGVVRGHNGAPLAEIAVRLAPRSGAAGAARRATTGGDGGFQFEVPPGRYRLELSAAGYGHLRRDLDLTGDLELDVALEPGLGASYRTVTVTAATALETAPAALTRGDMENLKDTLADDPLRSVQVLPGVVASDELRDDFTYRGAPFSEIAIAVDGLRPAGVMHTVESADSGSISFLNSDALAGAELRSVDLEEPSAGGTLRLVTRAADSAALHGSLTVGTASTSFTLGGPLARPRPGRPRPTLLLGARQSYLASLIHKIRPGTDTIFDFQDAFLRFDLPLTAHQEFAVQGLYGGDRGERGDPLAGGAFDTRSETGVLSFLTARWLAQYGAATLSLAVAHSRNNFLNDNRAHIATRSDRMARNAARLETQWSGGPWQLAGGWESDGERVAALAHTFSSTGPIAELTSASTDRSQFGFAELAWQRSGWRLSGGVNHATSRLWQGAFSGADLALARTGPRWGPGWAQHLTQRLTWFAQLARQGQFPAAEEAVQLLDANNQVLQVPAGTAPARLPARATLGETGFNFHFRGGGLEGATFARNVQHEFLGAEVLPVRNDRPPLPLGALVRVLLPQRLAALRARGFNLVLRESLGERSHGWVSYTYTRETTRDPLLAASYPSDFSTPQALTGFLAFRPRPAWNLVAIARANSSIPVLGFYIGRPGQLQVGSVRNQVRLPAYQRLDLRAERDFATHGHRLALFGEVLNVLGHTNQRFFTESLRYDAGGRVVQTPESLVPRILGLSLRFDY